MNKQAKSYKNKLKNKYFGLLREREKGGEWEKFLDTIIIELLGFSENNQTINYERLLNKTQSLKFLRYEYFRKTVFECMNLITGLDDQ